MSNYKVKSHELWLEREFKNYKELCEVMGWRPYKTGSSSYKAQVKELARYCKWTRKGHKWIIVELFEEKREKIDGRKGVVKTNEVQQCMEQILMFTIAHLNDNGKQSFRITKMGLFEMFGFINHNFKFCYSRKYKIGETLSVSSTATQYYFDRSYEKFTDRIDTLFKNLTSRKLLSRERVTVSCSINNSHVVVDEEIAERFVSAQRATLNEMGYDLNTAEYIIYAHGRWTEYTNRINKKLKRYNIKYCYRAYAISIADSYVEHCVKERDRMRAEGITVKSLKEKINAVIQEKNTKMFKDKQEKEIANRPTFGYRSIASKHVLSPQWLEDGEELFDKCGNINQSLNLREELGEGLEKQPSEDSLVIIE